MVVLAILVVERELTSDVELEMLAFAPVVRTVLSQQTVGLRIIRGGGSDWTDVITGTAGCFQGYFLPSGYRDVHAYYRLEDDFEAPGPTEAYSSQSYDYSTAAPTPPAQSTVEDNIDDELDDAANEDFKQWLNYQVGSPGESDPTGVGEDNPDIAFPDRVAQWQEHGESFNPDYDDEQAYWRGAANVITRVEEQDEGFYGWTRSSDGATIYVDSDRGAVVVVEDGVIVEYYVPTETQLDDLYFQRADEEFNEDDGVDDLVEPERWVYPWTVPPSTDWRRWCELSTPGSGLGSISTTPGPFESYTTPPSFTANTIGTADLLYGTNAEGGYGKWSDIQGFGVRMIAAKHGWTTADITATAATLLTLRSGALRERSAV